MFRSTGIAILLTLGCMSLGNSQETPKTWSLEECIIYALEQSLSIEAAQVNRDIANVNLRQARHQRWPSINAQAGAGLNFGRVINPATNNFETDDSYYNNFGANIGVPLFAGLRVNNGIKQGKLDLEASQEDLKQARVNLALDVTLAYLNVLFAKENLTNAQATRELSITQLEQIEKLITAGSRPEADRYDLEAQVALDNQEIVRFENEIERSLLALKQLMMLEPGFDLQIESPDLNQELLQRVDQYSYDEVYQAALETQPQIKAQELRIESAEIGEKLANGPRWLRISMGANIVSNWSDLAKEGTNNELQRFTVPNVFIDNQPVLFEQEQIVPTEFETIPYGRQLDNALGYGIALNVSIPIYNNLNNKANADRAKLNTILAQNTAEQVKQGLKTEIQNALASGRAARQALEASQVAFDAADIAYKNSERRFEVGTLNNYDLLNARNRLDAARVNLTISKYDYIFRILVLEFYMGRGIKYE